MSLSELNRIGTILKQALAMPTVDDLGRTTGQARRLRAVTPHRLFLAVVSAMAPRRVETLADLLRVFNHQQRVRVADKAFYNRLAGPGFEAFTRAMCGRVMQDYRLQTFIRLTLNASEASARECRQPSRNVEMWTHGDSADALRETAARGLVACMG